MSEVHLSLKAVHRDYGEGDKIVRVLEAAVEKDCHLNHFFSWMIFSFVNSACASKIRPSSAN